MTVMKLTSNINHKSIYIPFAEVFAKGIAFINVLIFIRILSINDYAIYSYALTVVLWASVLMDGGISNLIYKKSLKRDISNVNSLFFARLILSLSIIILLVVFIFFKKPEYFLTVLITSFIILFSSTSSLLKMFARGSGYTNVDIVTILSEPILRLVFLLFVLMTNNILKWNLTNVLLTYLSAGILAFIINYNKFKKHYRFTFIANSIDSLFNLTKKLIHESKYYLLYYLMLVGISRIDIIFIEKYAVKKDLAIYSSAINLYQVVQLFFFALISSQFLLLFKNKEILLKYLTPLLVVVTIFMISTSSYIYRYLFPNEYFNGHIILNFIILALLPSVINYYMITKNNYLNKTKINFIILFVFLILKIFLYSFFKSKYLSTYYTITPVIEFGILLAFLTFNRFYENTSDQ